MSAKDLRRLILFVLTERKSFCFSVEGRSSDNGAGSSGRLGLVIDDEGLNKSLSAC